jgi:hypothetical protein
MAEFLGEARRRKQDGGGVRRALADASVAEKP